MTPPPTVIADSSDLLLESAIQEFIDEVRVWEEAKPLREEEQLHRDGVIAK
jgi:hypothetical protein